MGSKPYGRGCRWSRPFCTVACPWLGHRGCRAAPSGSRGWNLKEPRLLKRAASVWLRTTLYPKAGQTYPDYPRSNTSSGGDDGDGHHHCHHPRWPSSAPTRITVLLAMVASIPHTGRGGARAALGTRPSGFFCSSPTNGQRSPPQPPPQPSFLWA